jgi:hypothetical protein
MIIKLLAIVGLNGEERKLELSANISMKMQQAP